MGFLERVLGNTLKTGCQSITAEKVAPLGTLESPIILTHTSCLGGLRRKPTQIKKSRMAPGSEPSGRRPKSTNEDMIPTFLEFSR